ncbi:MAG: sulfatase family protein [Thermoguttaceae bacterium]
MKQILLHILFTVFLVNHPVFGDVSKSLPAQSPNIVFIFADDMGYGDVSILNKNSKITTPNIDSLAKEGMIFTDAHAACSVCGPSRYAVLTGRYPMRNYKKSSNNNNGFGPPIIEKGRLTVAQMLKEKGYDTAAFGKWHLGMTWFTKDGEPLEKFDDNSEWDRIDYTKPIQDGPNSLGFDSFFGIGASLDMVPYVFIENDHVTEIPTEIKQNYPPRPGPAGKIFEPIDVLPTLTQKSIEYINEHGSKGGRAGHPFFLYLPLNAPHTPLVPTEKWRGKTSVGDYGDFCLQVDDTVGQIIDALDKNGLRENTLVIFTSDNGFAPILKPEEYEAKGHFPSYIYRGYKTDIYDGGHRMPFVASWKGTIKSGSKSSDMICLSDFMATCAEITGYSLPEDAAEDSFSFLSILQGKEISPENRRNHVVHLSPRHCVSIRDGGLKLVVPAETTQNPPKWKSLPAESRPKCEFYDTIADPSEKHDIAKENPERVEKMLAILQTLISNGRSRPGTPQKSDTELKLLPGVY